MNVTITNLTLTNGMTGSTGNGAVTIYSSGTLTVDNITFTNNDGLNGGGAIAEFGSLTVNNCTFTNNNATNGGGGYYRIWQFDC